MTKRNALAESSSQNKRTSDIVLLCFFLSGFLMESEEPKQLPNSVDLITDNHPDLEYTFLEYEGMENKSEWLKIYNTDEIEKHLAPLKTYFHSLSENEIDRIEEIRATYVSQLYAEAYGRLAVAKAKEDPDAAVELYKKALKYNPNYGLVYANLGTYYYERGRIEEAISSYEKALENLSDVPELWYALGRAYWFTKRSDKAIEAWSHAVKIKPDFAAAQNDLGVAYMLMGDYQSAIEAYKKAIKFGQDNADTYYNMGLAYEGISQWENAAAAYRKAIALNPNFIEALEHLRRIGG